MQTATKTALLLFGLLAIRYATAQQWQVSAYNFSYRHFEMYATNHGITGLGPLMQNPRPYHEQLSRLDYNGLSGGQSIVYPHTFLIGTEWRRNTKSRFWKNQSIPLGLLATNRLTIPLGYVENRQLLPDTTLITKRYVVHQQLQYAGLLTGFNKRIPIGKNLTVFTGLQLQGSLTLVQQFSQFTDSTVFTRGRPSRSFTDLMPTLEGKRFFQWQVYVPIALEANLYRKQYLVRAELNLGYAGNRFRRGESKYANGVGFSFVYRR